MNKIRLAFLACIPFVSLGTVAQADAIMWVAPDIGSWVPVPIAGVPNSGVPAGTMMRVLEQKFVGGSWVSQPAGSRLYAPVELTDTGTDSGEHTWTNTPGVNNAYSQTGTVEDRRLRIQFDQNINGHSFVAAFLDFMQDQDADPLITIIASGSVSPASLGVDYDIDDGYRTGAGHADFTQHGTETPAPPDQVLHYNAPVGGEANSSILFDRAIHGHHLTNFIATMSGLKSDNTHSIRFGFTDSPSAMAASVPEPSSFLFLGLILTAAIATKRFRAKNALAAEPRTHA